MVRVWVAGDPLVKYGPYLSALEIKGYIRRWINSCFIL